MSRRHDGGGQDRSATTAGGESSGYVGGPSEAAERHLHHAQRGRVRSSSGPVLGTDHYGKGGGGGGTGPAGPEMYQSTGSTRSRRRASTAYVTSTAAAPAVIRLETLSKTGTRWLLFVTYSTMVAAVFLSVASIVRLNFSSLLLPEVTCSPGTTGAGIAAELGKLVGCSVYPATNESQFVGTVAGLDALGGQIAVTLELENITACDLHVSSAPPGSRQSCAKHLDRKVRFRVMVHGGTHSTTEGDWSDAPVVYNSTTSRWLTQSRDTMSLAILQATDFTHTSVSNGFSRYRLSISMDGLAPLQIAEAATWQFSYTTAIYNVSNVVMRVGLLAGTLITMLVWVVSHRNTPRQDWLPQHKWVNALQVAVVLWQNPLAVADLLAGATLPRDWHAAAQMLQVLSWGCLTVFWLLMIDGLRIDGSYVPWSFYLPKLAFGLLFLAAAAWLKVTLRPQLWLGLSPGAFDSDPLLLKLTVAAAICFVALLAWWLAWFIYSSFRTGRLLRQRLYAATRFRQLVFRFLVFQQVAVIAYTIVTNAVPLIEFLTEADDAFGTATNASSATALVYRLVSGQSGLGELLLLSVYEFIIVYVHLPPHTRFPVPRFRLLKGLAGLDQDRVPDTTFDLNLGSWLFDLAWSAYYDPDGWPRTPASFGVENPPHGFTVDQVVSSDLDTYVQILRRGNRVVLAFRGSSSRQNFTADFQFGQGNLEFTATEKIVNAIPGLGSVVLPMVHNGFAEGYRVIREEMLAALRESVRRAGVECRVYCTGHSMGGALATLAALDAVTAVAEEKERMRHGAPGAAGADSRRRGSGDAPVLARSASAPLQEPLLTDRRGSGGDYRGIGVSARRALHVSTSVVDDGRPALGVPQSSSMFSSGLLSTVTDGVADVLGTRLPDSVDGGDWLGDRGHAGIDAAEENDQIVGFLREELENLVDTGEGPAGLWPGGEAGFSPRRAGSQVDEAFDESVLDVVMVNFGSPRVGNHSFATLFDKLVPYAFRVCFEGDVVTGFPKFLWLFKHVGHEVELDAFGNVMLDPTDIEKTFRSRTKRRFSSHSMYQYRDGLRAARRIRSVSRSPLV